MSALCCKAALEISFHLCRYVKSTDLHWRGCGESRGKLNFPFSCRLRWGLQGGRTWLSRAGEILRQAETCQNLGLERASETSIPHASHDATMLRVYVPLCATGSRGDATFSWLVSTLSCGCGAGLSCFRLGLAQPRLCDIASFHVCIIPRPTVGVAPSAGSSRVCTTAFQGVVFHLRAALPWREVQTYDFVQYGL